MTKELAELYAKLERLKYCPARDDNKHSFSGMDGLCNCGAWNGGAEISKLEKEIADREYKGAKLGLAQLTQ